MYKVHLESFQGPLDLLLYFIRRDEIDIYDIPIAGITAEYMDALDLMKEFNISIAGEFILMAATLMRIKARMLLPKSPFDEGGEIEDPRTALVQQLLEYQKIKEIADKLNELADVRSRFFPRGFEMELTPGEENPGIFLKDVTLFDIARYFKNAMEKMPLIHSFELHREPISLEEQKSLILASFDGDGCLLFSTLISKLTTKLEVIVTFLAILELIRLTQVTVLQNKLFGEIEFRYLGSYE